MSRPIPLRHRGLAAALIWIVSLALGALALPGQVVATESALQRYVVIFNGTYALDGSYALGGDYALNHEYALSIVRDAGGAIVADLTRQVGLIVADSPERTFRRTVKQYALVQSVIRDFGWQQYPSLDEALDSGALTLIPEYALGPSAEGREPLEGIQWNMEMIRARRAHAVQDGRRKVDVGVVDTGIDSTHVDFIKNGRSNVDTSRGASFAGSPDVAVDNQFHGTHVAGIIAARNNGHGVIGVAPDVTLVPIKVCDASGFCYASAVARGIIHAGDERLDVVNTSLFADDAFHVPPHDVDTAPNSTQFKCLSDPVQAGFRLMVERAIRYARSRGVAHVSAIGNSDTNLRKPGGTQDGATDADCDVVPAEVDGVTAVVALGPDGTKSSYSSYGKGHADVAAPGGDAFFIEESCVNEVTSTIPGNLWGCFQGTSMASPHVSGVAALIVSQFGRVAGNGDVRMPDGSVDRILKATAVDIGRAGNDKCYGHGRVDALRAVKGQTKTSYKASGCDDY